MVSPYLPTPVDPFSRDSLLPPIFFDGFTTLTDIDKRLQATVVGEKPLFAVVIGGTGTGRSAAAKYVLERYRELRNIDAARFVIPDINPNDSALWTHTAWLQRLARLVTRLRLGLETLTVRVRTAVAQPAEHTFVNDYAACVESYAAELAAKGAGYGVCIENVSGWPIIDSAMKIFEDAAVPCVFTVKEYGSSRTDIFTPFTSTKDPSRIGVELTFLSGADVARFADEHWLRSNPDRTIPFEVAAIKVVFDRQQALSIAKARTLLSRLHNLKEELDPDGPPWDARRLETMLANVMYYD